MIVLVTGVSGSGKTTVGQLLAARLGYEFADADDWHSEANVNKMHSGIPLTDRDREEWLTSLHTAMEEWTTMRVNVVLACSALKQAYRQHLVRGIENNVRLVYLSGPPVVLQKRLTERTDHFMPATLLDSQLDIAEPPSALEAFQGDITKPPEELVEEISSSLRLTLLISVSQN